MSDLKIGDKVMVVGGSEYHYFKIGLRVKIIGKHKDTYLCRRWLFGFIQKIKSNDLMKIC